MSIFEMIALACMVFAALVLVGDALRWLFNRVRHWLYRYMPERSANVAGFLLTVFLVITVTRDGVLDRMIATLDSSVTVAQQLFDTAPRAPDGDMITGGNGSLVSWQALGQPGRDYVMNGPTSAQIAAFTGRDAQQPIRVYVGLAQAATVSKP